MKSLTYISIIIIIVYMFAMTGKSYSLVIHSQETDDEIAMKPISIDNKPPLNDYVPVHQSILLGSYPIFKPRRSDSAEKYFGWASKTNRPMEYFRGRRFWLFTKKDDQGVHPESVSNAGGSPNSLSQGIWRSGIVGRRR